MGRYLCPLEDVQKLEGKRFLVVRLDDKQEIGVMLSHGRPQAFFNRCPHMGGPVCLGDVVGRTEAQLGEHQSIVREYVSEEDVRIICPWHGIEYNVETGVCTEDPRWQLRKVDAYIQDGGVYANLG